MDPGDTSWMLCSSALVMIMTPGLGFFYGGMVKRSNMLSTITYCFIIFAEISIIWYLIGFSLVFSPTENGFIGDLEYAVLENIGSDPSPYYATTIPFGLFFFYQLKFAGITPALIIGAVVDRVKLIPLLVFVAFWMIFVYFPIACWMWNINGWAFKLGVLDFAGGNVVHISSGFAALACAMQYPTIKREQREEPRSTAYTLLGCCLLWFGWFGFNGGSALTSGSLATVACINTNMAAASAGLTWILLEYQFNKKISMTGFPCGCVCGLVAITPACGFVVIWSSIIIGIFGSLGSFIFCRYKQRIFKSLGEADKLDVFGCHGISGIIGGIMTGLFCKDSINPATTGTHDGAFYGNGIQLGYQLAGIVSTAAWSFVLSYIILYFVKITMGLTLTEEEQKQGIDTAVHNEYKEVMNDFEILDFIRQKYINEQNTKQVISVQEVPVQFNIEMKQVVPNLSSQSQIQ